MKQSDDLSYTIAIQVHNRPGVLVRVAQTFARRGYNIESLHVSADLEKDEFSNMTITAFGNKDRIGQIVAHTRNLIDVIDVKMIEGTDK